MRGTGDWVQDQRPENWRETILYLYPNGSAPLTAIMSMMDSESTDDPSFNWWTKKMPEQDGSVTNIFDDSSLSSASSGSVASGTVQYVNVSEALSKNFKAGHQVLLRDTDDLSVDTVAMVQEVVQDGSSSYLKVLTLQTNDLSSIDYVGVVGSMYPEGDTIPDEVGYDAVKKNNLTQIFRTSLAITRTARKTRLRTGDAYQEMKREALELHAIEMEYAFLWSAKYEGTGDNGKPLRSTQGLLTEIRDSDSDGHTFDYVQDGSSLWTEGGEDWFDESLEKVFRHGKTEKLGLCGSEALLAINKLAKAGGQVNLRPMDASYGLKIVEWTTPFGTVYLKVHPLFSRFGPDRRSMVVMEPDRLRFRYVDDTFFKESSSERENTNDSKDATEEEFLTEGGLEYEHVETMGYFTNLGQDAS
jgi:hypothetical protein